MKSKITIWGKSTVSLITSLMLADKGIEHTFFTKNKFERFSFGKSLSNPIINSITRNTEEKYIPQNIIKQAPKLTNYESFSFNENLSVYRSTRGYYTSEVYAIDNRLRLDYFLNEINNKSTINLVSEDDLETQLTKSESNINIIGAGKSLSHVFKNLNALPTDCYKKERVVFFFNLKIDSLNYSKFEKKVSVYYIHNFAEILVYPFLHAIEAYTLNITINVLKGGQWDHFSNKLTSEQALELLKDMLPKSMDNFLSLIKHGEFVDVDFKISNSNSYFKKPTHFIGNNLYLGVGETISKSDPIVGQGYNSGLLMAKSLVENILLYNNNLHILAHSYENLSIKTMTEIYEINTMMTQGSKNGHLNTVFDLAAQNKPLCNFLLSTFEDTSLYFPWLTDESETLKLISRFKQKVN